jgi:caffeoyl-CoA O-methyltransferase
MDRGWNIGNTATKDTRMANRNTPSTTSFAPTSSPTRRARRRAQIGHPRGDPLASRGGHADRARAGAVPGAARQIVGARAAIEIGVFTGYSALAVALALPEDGRLLACDISDEYTRVGGRSGSARRRRARSTCSSARRSRRSTRASRAARRAATTSLHRCRQVGLRRYYERCLVLLRRAG